MRLVDSHAHLDEFDRVKPVLDRARRVGVVAVIAVGSSLESNLKTLAIATEYRGFVYPALGAHPWDMSSSPETLKDNFRLLEERIGEAVAVGEVGLDFWIKADKGFQIEVFRRAVELAKRHSKPLIVHSRGAWVEALKIVESIGVKDAVFHWYSGPREVLDKVLRLGYYVSATPAAQYSRYHMKAIKATPLSRIILETDSPVVYRNFKSEPSSIVKTLKAVSALKGLPVEVVAEETTRNAIRLFKLPL